ncbi:MAG TPA: dockerin type I repeat-containing protein, partial [Bacillota bacterium]|nr:dockerin type I repeat-containing protein [Bacillota bacterium]
GATNIYTIHIAKEAVAVNPYISSSLAIQGVGISGVGPGSTAAQVISVISVADGYSLQYLCADGTVKDGAAISVTGDLVQVINASGEVVYTGIIVVRGDLNGDGKISSSDLTMIARYITLQGSLSQAALLSGDVNKDGKISSADLTYMARHITKQTTIQP